MDLLKTILVYMSLIYTTAVTSADPTLIQTYTAPTATPTAVVTVVPATPAPTATPTPAPTINMTPNPEYKTLNTGDKGDDVRRLQTALTNLGYFSGKIDGAYGGQTRAAVIAFQTAHGLSADGIAGKRTLTILYESDEVRPAAGFISPTPTTETTPQPSISVVETTSQPTTKPTPSPTPSPAPSSTPVATATPAPTEPAAFVPIATEAVVIDEATAERAPKTDADNAEKINEEENEESVLQEARDFSIFVNGTQLELFPCTLGKKVYLPVKPILQAAGYSVLTNSSLDKDEIAFMTSDSYVLLSYTEDKDGNPINLEAYQGNDPQTIPDATIYNVNDIIYISTDSFSTVTGADVVLDTDAKTVTVTLEGSVNQ